MPSKAMDARPDLNLEILKLLLQVAWADDVVDDDEIQPLMSMAREQAVPEEELRRLADCLRGSSPLPPPNFGYLREHKDVALLAAERYLGAGDSERVRDSEAVMATIRELLG
jgi:hypothetical protein